MEKYIQLLALGYAAVTAVHAVLFGVSSVMPSGKVKLFFAQSASVTGVFGADIQKALVWANKAQSPTAIAAKIASAATTLVVCLLLSGCTANGQLTPQAKSIVTSIDDVAKRLCLLAYSQSLGVSLTDLSKDVCAKQAEIQPFLDAAISAQHAGAMRAGLAHP